MDIFEYISLIFTDYTIRNISLGTGALGAICGVLGSFAVLRKESLLGDAISHAALPGIVLAFMITQAKDNYVLLIGAIISGLIGTLLISGIVTNTRLKKDAALGIVLSVFFGFGMLLLTFIQKNPDATQAGLDKYLFGQAATLMENDVKLLSIVLGLSLLVLLMFWKESKVALFDSDYAKSIGIKTRFLDSLISFFIVLAIVLGLQTVGVVLMSAMLLAPAAAARQWTNRLYVMLIIAAILGVISGVVGTAVSTTYNNLSTGPVIVVIAILIVIISFLFSPKRGLLMRQILFIRSRKKIEQTKVLLLMYNIAKTHDDVGHPHSNKILNNFQGIGKNVLKSLENQGWIKVNEGMWLMTEKGFNYAEELNKGITL